MARKLNYSARYPVHSTEEVYRALASRIYWETRMAAMHEFTQTANDVVSFQADDSGIEVELRHVLPRSELPEIAQAVQRKDMLITRKESYSAYGSESTGKYEASIPAGPGSLTGTMRLFETETGSTLRITSEAKVYIPFVGPKLEQLMLVNLVDLFRVENEFTKLWLDGRWK